MKNILVTGCNGQLGSEIKLMSSRVKEYCFFFVDIDDLDITNHSAVESYILKKNINIIINCAAYTSVDKAESEIGLANSINNLAVAFLAKKAKEKGISLVHISTDYVFDGTNSTPYIEDNKTNPKSVYGKTKLEGELAILKINPANSIIIRTSWVYSKFGNNFVKSMIELFKKNKKVSIVADQIGSPTNAADLAETILKILPELKDKNTNIYHYSNEGVCSWYDFAIQIMDLTKLNCKVLPISSDEFPTSASRPNYSVMSKSKIKNNFNLVIPHWKHSLKQMIDNYLN